MEERDTLSEHDWELAEDQTLPDPEERAVNIGARVWQCTKCFAKAYLRNKPPPRFHRERPATVRGLRMNWDNLDDVDKIGCSEIVIKDVHES